MDYDVKRGHSKNVEGKALSDLMKEVFGNVAQEGDLCVSSFGVMSRIEAKLVSKDNLYVATVSKPADGLTDQEILDSKRKLNVFLEKATGFDAKARMKRAQEKVKKGLA